jgi:spore maturation protein CgeB
MVVRVLHIAKTRPLPWLLPDGTSWDVVKAFKSLGHKAMMVTLTEPVTTWRDRTKKFNPDLIVCQCSPENIRQMFPNAVIWFFQENSLAVKGRTSSFNPRGADFVSFASKVSMQSLKLEEDGKHFLMPVPIDPDVMNPENAKTVPDMDVCFIGQRKEYRNRIIQRLKQRKFSVRCYGLRWAGLCSYHEFPMRVRGRVNLNLRERPEWPVTPSTRVARVLACGGFILSERGALDPFKEWIHYGAVTYEKDIPELVKYWLEDETRRKAVAQNGHDFVMQNLTIQATARRMLEAIQK